MKTKNICAILITLNLLAVSCRQDPIFHVISTETAPRPPRIEGAPTNMVVFQREYPGREPVSIMYVASGRLHWYAKSPGNVSAWDSDEYLIPQPDGKIISLAVAGKRLYALCREGSGVNAKLRYIKSNGNEWETINSDVHQEIQSIYTDAETSQLFAGAGRNNYAILYLDNASDTLKMLKSDTSIFSGAVYRDGDYYFSTRGSGIFKIAQADLAANKTDSIKQLVDNTDIEEDKRNDNLVFISMIKLNDNTTIIAVERNGGALYEVHGDSFRRMKYTIGGNTDWIATGRYATRAIALWQENPEGGRKLLTVGIQGGLYSTTTSSYTYGYIEFDLKSDDSFDTGFVSRDPIISVRNDNDRYTATLGKHPVNHLFQAPREVDDNMTFFASTQTAGLWSYRDRPDNGGWQWNGEE